MADIAAIPGAKDLFSNLEYNQKVQNDFNKKVEANKQLDEKQQDKTLRIGVQGNRFRIISKEDSCWARFCFWVLEKIFCRIKTDANTVNALKQQLEKTVAQNWDLLKTHYSHLLPKEVLDAQAVKDKRDGLKATIAIKEAELATAKEAHDALAKQFTDATETAAQQKTLFDQAVVEKEKAATDLAEAQAKLTEANATIKTAAEAYTLKLEDLQKTANPDEAAVKAAKAEVEQKAKELADAQKAFADLDAKLKEAIEKAKTDAEAKESGWTKKIQETTEAHQVTVNGLTKQLEEATAQQKAQTEEHTNAVNALNKQIAALQEAQKNAGTSSVEQTKELAELKTKLEGAVAKSDLDASLNLIADLKDQLNVATNNLADAKKAEEKADADQKALKAQVDQLTIDAGKLKGELTASQFAFTEAEKDFKKKLEETQLKDNDILNKMDEDHKLKVQDLQTKQIELENEVDKLKQAKDDADTKAGDAQTALEAAEKLAAERLAEIGVKSNDIKTLETQVQAFINTAAAKKAVKDALSPEQISAKKLSKLTPEDEEAVAQPLIAKIHDKFAAAIDDLRKTIKAHFNDQKDQDIVDEEITNAFGLLLANKV